MPNSKRQETQYGVRYPDGTEDWDTRSWYGHIETASARATFEEQYLHTIPRVGEAPKLVFLTRVATTTYGKAEEIIDAPEPTPGGEDYIE